MAKLNNCQSSTYSGFKTEVWTYTLPGQLRGPIEKACATSRLSLAYCGSPSQRSGMKENGDWKFSEETLAQ
jgi:hypothetical protein